MVSSQNLLTTPFRSFSMGGYECTDQLNCFGNRVDFLHLTGHGQLQAEDYKQLHPFNIRTVREGIRWSQVEKRAYQYDWTTVSDMIDTGKACGIQQLWDICHFGFPDDLTPLHPMFARRFAALCQAFVHFYRSKNPDETLIVTPVNEVSFLSWLGGDSVGTAPYCNKQGWEVKYGLMRAYIEGTAAMKEIDPNIKIMSTEPLVNMVPPLNANKDMIRRAKEAHEHQFQAMDILCGRTCPELGGSPAYLDLLGLNHYYNNQWVFGSGNFFALGKRTLRRALATPAQPPARSLQPLPDPAPIIRNQSSERRPAPLDPVYRQRMCGPDRYEHPVRGRMPLSDHRPARLGSSYPLAPGRFMGCGTGG